MATVNPCVRAVLCPLAGPVLSTLKGIIETQVALLQSQLTNITATLAVLEVGLVPLDAASALVETTLGTVRAAGDLVPISIMAGCAPVGNAMISLNASLDQASAAAQRVLGEAKRYSAYKAELEARQATIEAALEHFTDVLAEMELC